MSGTDIQGDAKTQGGDLVGRDKIVKEQNNLLGQMLELQHRTIEQVTRAQGKIERLDEKFTDHCNQAGEAQAMSEQNRADIMKNKQRIDTHMIMIIINTVLLTINLIMTSLHIFLGS